MNTTQTAWNTPNEPCDIELVQNLARRMKKEGWVGSPMLVDAETGNAFTGSHRQAAAAIAGIEPKTMDVAELDGWDREVFKRVLEDSADPSILNNALYAMLDETIGNDTQLRELNVETW